MANETTEPQPTKEKEKELKIRDLKPKDDVKGGAPAGKKDEKRGPSSHSRDRFHEVSEGRGLARGHLATVHVCVQKIVPRIRALVRNHFSVFATIPCVGLSLSR